MKKTIFLAVFFFFLPFVSFGQGNINRTQRNETNNSEVYAGEYHAYPYIGGEKVELSFIINPDGSVSNNGMSIGSSHMSTTFMDFNIAFTGALEEDGKISFDYSLIYTINENNFREFIRRYGSMELDYESQKQKFLESMGISSLEGSHEYVKISFNGLFEDEKIVGDLRVSMQLNGISAFDITKREEFVKRVDASN